VVAGKAAQPKTATLADLTPDPRNANKGTPRGRGMVEESLRKFGGGRSLLVDKHGVIIAGNKTHEAAGSIGLDECIMVPTDGTKLVVVQRTDLDLRKDKAAQLMALADNRTSEVGLAYEPEVIAEFPPEDLSWMFTAEERLAVIDVTPEFTPVGIDEQGRLDEKKKVKCPECGHWFAPA